jgi:hypothetical protein
METRTPYDPPDASVADRPAAPGHFTRGEKVLLVLLLVNAGAGAFFIIGTLLASGMQSPLFAAALLLPALGFVAAALMFRYPVMGLVLGMVFYALQTIQYVGPEGNWGIRSGFNVSYSIRHGDGVLIINLLAMVLAFAHVVVARYRRERSRPTTTELISRAE